MRTPPDSGETGIKVDTNFTICYGSVARGDRDAGRPKPPRVVSRNLPIGKDVAPAPGGRERPRSRRRPRTASASENRLDEPPPPPGVPRPTARATPASDPA